MTKNFFEKANFKLLFGILLAAFVMTTATNSFADFFPNYIKNNVDGSQTLTGHVPLEVKNAKAAFINHANQNINARIIMPLANQSQLSSLLKDLYDPKSPNFHQFLTPAQFAHQFTASTVDSALVQSFFNKNGISVTAQSPNGTVLNVMGPVSAFEKAFGLHINNYQKTDGTMFFAPDADPIIPATLAGKILAVGGLDNLAKYHPHYQKSPVKTLAKNTIVGTGAGGYLAPNDVKTAYNLNTVPSTGSGQTLALFELDGYSSSDITAYDAQFGLPGVPLQNILIDGFGGVPNFGLGGGAPEVTLDIELMTAFAQGSSDILVYEAPNTTQSWIDEWSQMASDNKAKVISCSWGEPEQDSATISFDSEVFQQMAAQGQAVFAAAGDNGAYCEGSNPPLCLQEPSAQPYVTAVGISTLSTNADGTYNNETASIYGAGGISAYQAIPFYQTMAVSQANPAAMASTVLRNVPDVVLTADAATGYAFYIDGEWGGYFGSSLSSPIWASFMSLVNQGLGQNGPLGFANPLLYQLAQSSNYANDFHDITTGNNGDGIGTGYLAEPGFDDATGLGSFNGLNLYNDLLNQVSLNPVAAPSAPVSLNATAGNGQVILTWSASTGATSYDVKRATVSGGPYTIIGSPVTFNTSYVDNTVSKGNTYYYVVSAVNAKGQGANSVQTSATPFFQPPSMPVGLTAIPDNGQVDLSWSPSFGAASYNIKRATVSGGPYTTVGSALTTTYTDTSVVAGTAYYYVLSAVNSGGESPNAAQVSATPLPPLIPSTPSILSATPGNNQVQLIWFPSTGAASYTVKRSTVSGGPYTTIAASVTTVFFLGFPYYEPAPIYTDNSVSNGTTYYYVISAVNSTGQSANSAQVSAAPLPPPSAPPVGLSASIDATGVVLTWNASAGATGYMVKRATVSGGPYLTVNKSTVTAATTTFTDSPAFGLIAGTTYYYVVSAENSAGQSANSAQISTTFKVLPPFMPTGLSATVGNAQVTLAWTSSAGAATFNIKRATVSGGPYTTIASVVNPSQYNVSSGGYSYIDTSVSIGTTYYYVVSGENSAGEGTNSAQVSATALALLPSVPSSLSAVSSNAQVTLTWSDSAGATSFNIKRATVSGGPYTTIASVADTMPNLPAVNFTYTDISVSVSNAYYYVISAANSAGESANSAQVSITVLGAPPLAPVGLSAGAGNALVALTWAYTPGAASFNVKRATVSGGPYTTIANVAPDVPLFPNPYTDTSVTNGTTYYYVVSAVNSAGESPNSAQVSAMPNVPSASGTIMPPASQIIDSTYNVWTFSGGSFYENGVLRTASGTNLLLYYENTIWEQNSGNIWYAWTGSNWIYISAGDPMIPPTPLGLSAVTGNGNVTLQWSPSFGAVSYNVKRSTVSGGPYIMIGSALTTTYTDISGVAGTTYYYVVSGVDPTGESTNSTQVSATFGSLPSAPVGLSATTGNGFVLLQWNPSSGTASCNLKRATVSGGPYTTITSQAVGLIPVGSYKDTSVVNGTTYYYVVSGVNSGGEGANSAQVSATPQLPSAGGTIMPPASQIIDSASNVWTYSGGSFFENGVFRAGSITGLLLYYNGTIYAQNTGNLWYSWSAIDPSGDMNWVSVPSGDPMASASGTSMPAASQIIDNAGNVWTHSGSSFFENGVFRAGSVSQLLLYYNGTIYAQNTNNLWYSWTGSTWVYLPNGDPMASASGTIMPPALMIIDSQGIVWTVVNGNSMENGVADSGHNITLLLYYNGNIYADTTGNGWWSHAGGSWKQIPCDPRIISSNGTTVPPASNIVDSKGTVWTVVNGYSYENGVADSGANITLLLYYNGNIYADTSVYGWWSHASGSWQAISHDPRVSK